MSIQLIVLGSGSSGNAALLDLDGASLLIDAGLGPRQIKMRLKPFGYSWESVDSVILTHTHGDHWRESTLSEMVRHQIPMYVSRSHAGFLRTRSTAFQGLESKRCVHFYKANSELVLPNRVKLLPVPVPHDAGPTFAFRIEREAGLFSSRWSMGFVSDLGHVPPKLPERFANLNLLAVEFNYDDDSQRNSDRPWQLVQRCLGPKGHLSNDQAAEFVSDVLSHSDEGLLTDVVQLHLSRQCNSPSMARDAAMDVLEAAGITPRLFTGSQTEPVMIEITEPDAIPSRPQPASQTSQCS